MKSLVKSGIYVLVFNLILVAQTNKPAWINSRDYSIYPDSRYLIGVGIAQGTGDVAKDKQNADNNALAQISQQILARVKSTSENKTLEIIKNDKSNYSQESKTNVDVSSEVKLLGVKIADKYYDEKNNVYYSLGVLDKFISLNYLKNRLSRQRLSFFDNLKMAKDYINNGSFPSFIQKLKEINLLSSEFNDAVSIYIVLSSQNSYKDSLDTSLLPEQASTDLLNDVLSKIAIIKVSGDSQKVMIQKPDKVPLIVKLVYKASHDVPLNGISVNFNFVKGEGKFSEIQQSDNEGKVRATITKLGESFNKTYLINAKINFFEFLDTTEAFTNLCNILKNYKKTVLFSLEQLELFKNSNALVIINFRMGNQKIDSEPLFSSISKKLLEHDITAINLNEVKSNVSISKDMSEYKDPDHLFNSLKLDKSRFSIIIECDLLASYINKIYGYESYSLNGNLRAFSLSQNKLIASEIIKNIKGAAISPELAASAALKKIPATLLKEFVNSIVYGYHN